MSLENDEKLIEEYKRRHAPGAVWPEIIEGIKSVGILRMDIYIKDTTIVMILEADSSTNLDEAFAKLATLPRQQEWEDYMSIFQKTEKGVSSGEKWMEMEQFFDLWA